jgi:hypothetical protein
MITYDVKEVIEEFAACYNHNYAALKRHLNEKGKRVDHAFVSTSGFQGNKDIYHYNGATVTILKPDNVKKGVRIKVDANTSKADGLITKSDKVYGELEQVLLGKY